VQEVSGHSITGQAVSRYFHDGAYPKPAFMRAFAVTFDLSEEERDRLAWAYTFGINYRSGAAEGRRE
jgi:hypothetical protein